MRLGTRSVLYGAHCFFIHPWFVALGWFKLHGFRIVRDHYVTTCILDPRLWVAFWVHDIGYLGKPNMDGPEGEEHPWVGAKIMHALFDWPRWKTSVLPSGVYRNPNTAWRDFVLYHSRYLAKKYDAQPSAFCVADKYAALLEPTWLYIPRVVWTGEVIEYVNNWRKREGMDMTHPPTNREIGAWYKHFMDYMVRWIAEHRDGRADTWTDRSWRETR